MWLIRVCAYIIYSMTDYYEFNLTFIKLFSLHEMKNDTFTMSNKILALLYGKLNGANGYAGAAGLL